MTDISKLLEWAEWNILSDPSTISYSSQDNYNAAISKDIDNDDYYAQMVGAFQKQQQQQQQETASKASSGKKETINEAWIYKNVKKFVSPDVADYIFEQMMEILKSRRSDDEIQEELFTMIGNYTEECMQFILTLFDNRSRIRKFKGDFLRSQQQQQQDGKLKKAKKGEVSNATKLLEQLRRTGGYSDRLGLNCDFVLPKGTVQNDQKTFEEYIVPAHEVGDDVKTRAREPIESFDEWARGAFKGYKTLNPVQTVLFEPAYRNSGNLLVCAPTGAGKTNIALMTILRELGRHLAITLDGQPKVTGGSHDIPGVGADFKIVYVAPMKALAQEVTRTLGERLAYLGVEVRELTGDTQLTKREIGTTHIIVTTPEKWDVVTRKSTESSLASMVRLLIIDEVHLLNEDRGPVLETLVSRTHRLVERTQMPVRLVGLSATLPNYRDVGEFLKADPVKGIFYFDPSYRPVQLSMDFIGTKTRPNDVNGRNRVMNDICFDKLVDTMRRGNQAMVFVNSRKDTVTVAKAILEIARKRGLYSTYFNDDSQEAEGFRSQVLKSKNAELRELFPSGVSIHHAGMLRQDRSLVERMFAKGAIRVLFCTATLAWGVNLPTHTVIIRGTEVYNAEKGGFVPLGTLDVMQIFGRAGRPQFDTSGEAVIITTQEMLNHYLRLLTSELPIESQFSSRIEDHLNAEIVMGNITNVNEGINWLSYTYLYIRMLKNPLLYGLTWDEKEDDPLLVKKRRALIVNAARTLDEAQMIRFDETSGNFGTTTVGRVASHYYIRHESMRMFNEQLHPDISEGDLLELVCKSDEFESLRFRTEELDELDNIAEKCCYFGGSGSLEESSTRTRILYQAYLARAPLYCFTLVMDSAYIVQNITRIFRGLFELAVGRGECSLVALLLNFARMTEQQIFRWETPLIQFCGNKESKTGKRSNRIISPSVISRLEKLNDEGFGLERILDMDKRELGALLNVPDAGADVLRAARMLPFIDISATVQPITRTVLRVELSISPKFVWNDRFHGGAESFWIFMEDAMNERIYHKEHFVLTKKMYLDRKPIPLMFNVPVSDPLPPQYYIHTMSDRWLGIDTETPLSFRHLILPLAQQAHTPLLNLRPLPLSALKNPAAERLFKFRFFNPVQTQIFHTCYYTDHNVLLGAPTGSGKTVAAELAMLKVFRDYPGRKVVYIAPLKALVRERIADWGHRFGRMLGKRVVELTGDFTPNVAALRSADIVLTTPEKWDGVSRSWKTRSYVKLVALVVIDEIHMLGEERGPVLEVIVSRMRFISSQTAMPVRLMGLSTAVANAQDLVDWLGVPPQGVYNFNPSVRPVRIEGHIEGHPGKHYCPRMATMNKPAYAAIKTFSEGKPTLVFVASRRQTRLTALGLASCADLDVPRPEWLKISREELADTVLPRITDSNVAQLLGFGIGIHHAGLCDEDRAVVEELFRANKIQILVSTSTLAWGVNLPAHLVVIKGTEYYDAKTCKYVDFPVTDVLQMMGRAGRPQYDTKGVAVILVEESKKDFYRKFLYEPFPVESRLPPVLHDHINAEICSGTIASKQDAIEYLTWTYFFRRLTRNPAYYGVSANDPEHISEALSALIDATCTDLEYAHCIRTVATQDAADGSTSLSLETTPLGRIASFYYLHYTTIALFCSRLNRDADELEVLSLLCDSAEYDQLPVRHCEDATNAALAGEVPHHLEDRPMDDPHTKAHLLCQAHISRVPLPSSDYVTDTKSVLDQAIRILQAIVDVSAEQGWLRPAMSAMHLVEMLVQACWLEEDPLLTLPGVTPANLPKLKRALNVDFLPQLLYDTPDAFVRTTLPKADPASWADPRKVDDLIKVKNHIPRISIALGPVRNPVTGRAKVRVDITHAGGAPLNATTFAYAPQFPKLKQDGWWVFVGVPETGELLALRRLSLSARVTTLDLTFDANVGSATKKYALYFMSDTYIGINQQHSFEI